MAVFLVGDQVINKRTKAIGTILKIVDGKLFIDWIDMGISYTPRDEVKTGPFEPTDFYGFHEQNRNTTSVDEDDEAEIPRFSAIAGEL